MPLGPTELIIILVILLLLFGAKRLPELGRSLGGGMREFKDSVTGKDDKPEQADRSAPAALNERGDIPPVVPNPPEPQPARTDVPADPAAHPTPPPTDRD